MPEVDVVIRSRPVATEAMGSTAAAQINLLPGIAWIEPRDVTAATLFLASDDARFITGVALPIDAGHLVK